jgi:hypothetical protein
MFHFIFLFALLECLSNHSIQFKFYLFIHFNFLYQVFILHKQRHFKILPLKVIFSKVFIKLIIHVIIKQLTLLLKFILQLVKPKFIFTLLYQFLNFILLHYVVF